MTRTQRWKAGCAVIALLAMTQIVAAPVVMAADSTHRSQPKSTQPTAPTPATDIVIAPGASAAVQQVVQEINGEKYLTHDQKLKLLQQKIKYVFVIFQENRSFDHYFGTFPGAQGLFSQPANMTAGFTQPIVKLLDPTNPSGGITSTKVWEAATISPFLIPQSITNTAPATVPIYPADTASVDHSHSGMVNDVDVVNTISENDRYALDQEGMTTLNGHIYTSSSVTANSPVAPTNVTLAKEQMAELVMGHLDCDTVPFMWQYANHFTLFDNFHTTIIGPSAPNAIAMIAGQSGLTQWALHPGQGGAGSGAVVPDVGDNGPYAGSELDTSSGAKPPYGPNDESPASPTLNQTYASLPLSFMGKQIKKTIATDEAPLLDLVDVEDDINVIAQQKAVNWGWYPEGFDHEPTDGNGAATFDNYITHHNGPQYFGYVGDNPKVVSANLHGLQDFFTTISAKKLPTSGVFYIRGGYGNNDSMTPVDPTPSIQEAFTGNDDHASYSDAQISEAQVADVVNAIAASKYWKNSVIIITYDETDGLYDHQSVQPRATDSVGMPLSGGPRIPAILISPYAVVAGISHVNSEHSSIIKFIDEVFNLTPLADLPDEVNGRIAGGTNLGALNQPNLTPADDYVPDIGDLFEAFDNNRLSGSAALLTASYAEIPADTVHSLPHFGAATNNDGSPTHAGCNAVDITPTDYTNGLNNAVIDPAPAEFNPRPSASPGLPTNPGWTP